MDEKYFKNRNNNKSYSLQELINSGPIFNDDLIWKKGLSDWTNANNIEELEAHVLERPPQRKSRILLKRIIWSILPSIIILLIFSVIVGVTAGFLEKHQYNAFIEKVQPNIDEHLRMQQQRAEFERNSEIENQRKIEQVDINLDNLYNKYLENDKELESLQNISYNNYLNASTTYYKDLYGSEVNTYIEKRKKLMNDYKSDKRLLELSLPTEPINLKSSSISLGSYNVPINTLYAVDDNGNDYTRWSVYQGVGNHEQISYESNKK